MKYFPPRSSRCERLESRRLLAGDVCLVSPAEAVFVADGLRVIDQVAAEAEQNPAPQSDPAGRPTADEVAYWMADRIVSARDEVERDLLVERDGVVAAFRAEIPQTGDPGAVAEASGGMIYLMHRDDGEELLERAAIAVDFRPRRLLLSERSLLVVGESLVRSEPSASEMIWMSVDLDDPSRRQTGSLAGVLSGVAVEGDRLFVSAMKIPEAMPAIYPPPPLPHTVAVFDISDGSAREIARGETFAAVTADALVGDDIVLLESRLAEDAVSGGDAWPQWRHELTRYRITETQIVRLGAVELGGGDDVRSKIAADGQTAVTVTRHPQPFDGRRESPSQSTFRVDLVDLSGEIPVLFQTIDVSTRSTRGAFEIGERAVVIADGLRRLWVVDVNQQIDVDPAARVSLVEYALQGGLGALSPLAIHEVTADRFLITHPKRSIGETSDTSSASTMQLALFSVETLAVRSVLETRAGSVAVFTDASDPPKQIRLRGSYALPPLNAELQVIRVGDDGSLSAGSLVSLDGVLESDANADRLLLRQLDRLVEYRWNALDAPIETPLGDALPSPVAVDDVFRRNADGWNVYLDVLANDQFDSMVWGTAVERDSEPGRSDRVRIVDLVAAPEGVSIFHDRQIRIDEALLRSGESFQFQYTISQFGQESTAEVRVDLYRFSDDDVDAALDNVRRAVSDAVSAPVEDIVVGRPIRYTTRTMPERLNADVENPLGGAYGVIVDVTAAGQLFRYAADFEGNVARLTERSLETVMALNLDAVDGSGQPVETLRVGDEFFIEVIAEDLRAFGAGVFGVAFDLAIPPQYLELTGVVELRGDFDQLGEAFGESGIDDFIALENIILHPGSAVQPVVRFGVRAVAGGEVTLQLAPADRLGAELLLRGRDSEVSPLETRFGGLDLFIEGIRPTDTDGNGRVTPLDALRVINFLGRHGVVEVDRLPQLLTGGEPESVDSQSDTRLTAMQRLDINADRWITPRDALLVINEVARIAARPTVLGTAEGESLRDELLQDETLLPGEPRLF